MLTLPLPVSASAEGKRCPSLIAAGLYCDETAFQFGHHGLQSLAELSEQPVDVAVVLESQLCEAFLGSVKALLDLMAAGSPAVIILIGYRPAPVTQFRPDGPVFSFMCSPAVLRQVLADHPDAESRDLCFELLHGILNGSIRGVERLLVRQLRENEVPRDSSSANLPVGLIMAHRGDACYLDTALRYLQQADGAARCVRVGLDVEEPDGYAELMNSYPDVNFFRVTPTPSGPYVIRQALATLSPEPLLALQDSDDLSCYDRFTVLAQEMSDTGCDMIGSHELRVDEIERHIVAVRFPLDATAALRERNVFALLHATLMIRRDAFFRAGGLSTDQRVANDTQFLMRAFFYFLIRNVDEFLYIRRRHRRALTIAPETAAGNELRTRLDRQWTEDFEAVKRGDITLEESSLRPMHGRMAYTIEPMVMARAGGPENSSELIGRNPRG